MKMVTNKELFEAFAREYPNSLSQLSRNLPEEQPYDTEAFEETSKYDKLPWEQVELELLSDCYDIHLLFSENAFHYFFPAFIKQTQLHYDELELFVDSLVFFITNSNDEWSESRWRLFSIRQLELVEKWLNWLCEKVDSLGIERVYSAINKVKQLQEKKCKQI